MKSVHQITFDFTAVDPVKEPAEVDMPPVIQAPEGKKRGRKPKDPTTIFKKIPEKRGRKSLKDVETEADLVEIPDDELLYKKQYYSTAPVSGLPNEDVYDQY